MTTFDYENLQELFERQLITLTPAEAQGLLAALLSAGETEPEEWLGLLFGSVDAASGLSPDEGLRLASLFGDTQRALDAEDFGFELLLPDDDIPMTDRVGAVTTWCQGYLYGLGVRGLADSDALSEDARELIEDLIAISRAEPDEDHEDEDAYAEIVEYLRVGALSIHEDLRPLRDAVEASETLH